MTRIKRGYITRRRQTKISLFASSFREAYSRLTRTITQQRIKVLVLAQQDRDRDIGKAHIFIRIQYSIGT